VEDESLVLLPSAVPSVEVDALLLVLPSDVLLRQMLLLLVMLLDVLLWMLLPVMLLRSHQRNHPPVRHRPPLVMETSPFVDDPDPSWVLPPYTLLLHHGTETDPLTGWHQHQSFFPRKQMPDRFHAL
jgi:hypothetical protein